MVQFSLVLISTPLDILGLDILGLDILGLDILGRFRQCIVVVRLLGLPYVIRFPHQLSLHVAMHVTDF